MVKSDKTNNNYVILYYKNPGEDPITMTKPSSLRAAKRSKWKFGLIGIEPCEIVNCRPRKKNKKKK